MDILSLLTITQPTVTNDVDRMTRPAAVKNSATRAGMQKQHRRVYCAGGRESKTSSEGALGGRTMVVGDMDMIEVVKVNYFEWMDRPAVRVSSSGVWVVFEMWMNEAQPVPGVGREGGGGR